jgi:hypothetical protein
MNYTSLTFDGFLNKHRITRASTTKGALDGINKQLSLLREAANNMGIDKLAWRQDFTATDLPSEVKRILEDVYRTDAYKSVSQAVQLLLDEDAIMSGVEVMKQALNQLLAFININGPLSSIDSERISDVLTELKELEGEATGDAFYETPIVRSIVGYDMLMDDIRG